MSIVSYYFDAHVGSSDPQGVWTNSSNAFNGNVNSVATQSAFGSTATNYLQGDGTNAPTTGPTIISVKVRIGSRCGFYGVDKATVYTSGLAENLGNSNQSVPGYGWSNSIALTAPAAGWTWGTINTLSVKIYVATTNTVGIGGVWLDIITANDTVPVGKSVKSTDGMSTSGGNQT